MGQPLPLRRDCDAPALRAPARRSEDAAQSRRPPAPAAIHDGASRTKAAPLGGVTLQIVRDRVLRDRVLRLGAAGPEGLIDRTARRRASRRV
jgi:hypothetical protein